MAEIAFKDLAKIAMDLNQKSIKWHFHMLGTNCILSRLEEVFEIVLENEKTGETVSSIFNYKPVSETRQLAELAYGPNFLNQASERLSTNEDSTTDCSNPAFLDIMRLAKDCCRKGRAWHNHHLHPQCLFNSKNGQHCIVFEDETTGNAHYAYYDDDPLSDLAELEALFFGS